MKDMNIPNFELNTKYQDVLGWHDAVEILFVLCKGGNLSIGTDKTYEMKERDIAVININQLHSLSVAEGGAVLSFFIPSEYLIMYAPEEISHLWECFSFLERSGNQKHFDKIRKCLCEVFLLKDHAERLEFRSRVLDLLSSMDTYFLCNVEVDQPERNKQFGFVLDYLAKHYMEPVKLADVGEVAHFSESHLSRLFRQELGMNFKDYLLRLRASKGLSLLKNTDWSVTQIAYKAGFSSTNAFISSFKKIYQMTPGQYRIKYAVHKDEEERERYKEGTLIFQTLLQYKEADYRQRICRMQDVKVDASAKGKKLLHTWKRLLNIAYAQDLMTSRVQEQLIKIQKDIHFSMVRFLGICNDGMMLFHEEKDGTITYHFSLVDQILDFILSIDLKPFIVVGFMPEALARKKFRAYFNTTYVSMPKDMAIWKDMIERLIRHLAERYGVEEIRQWVFEIWNHPEVGMIIDTYTMKEYLEFYRETFESIKSVDGRIKIAGPDCKIESWDFLKEFLLYCKRFSCMPELLCLETFHFEEDQKHVSGIPFLHREDTLNGIISDDPHYLIKRRKKLGEILKQLEVEDIPVILSSWNSTSWQRDLCNDTASKAAFLFKEIWQTYDMWQGIGYWFALDYVSNDEVPTDSKLFHGGFGWMTENGVPKSSYRAIQLLSRAGDRLLLNHDGVAVTAGRDSLQIYLYNSGEYNQAYRYQHTDRISFYKRYQVFQEKEDVLYRIHIRNLSPGICTMRQFQVGPKAGSAYDEWLKMGAPENMNKEELDYLQTRTMPHYHTEQISHGEELKLSVKLEVHEIIYLELIFGK